jgi:hypothetical protein
VLARGEDLRLLGFEGRSSGGLSAVALVARIL